jgi:putative transferase (TIGR04331 family)
MDFNSTSHPKYLVLGGDASSYDGGLDLMFLGLWCAGFNSKLPLIFRSIECARPYGISKQEKDSDLKKAREIEKKLFPTLVITMNKIHCLKEQSRYWEIILGHWFRRYIEVLINRYGTVNQCLKENNIAVIELWEIEDSFLAKNNSLDAIWSFRDDLWNLAINSKIIKIINPSINISYIKNNINKKKEFRKRVKKKAVSILEILNTTLQKFINLIQKDTRPLILNTYLPVIDELKLQYLEGCFPTIKRVNKSTSNEKYSSLLRKNASKIFQEKKALNTEFEKVFFELLFLLMPKCYLEGFDSNRAMANLLPWPKYPKYIFTSNNFDTDELFKIWTAKKVSEGAKYIVGQHGANYGTSKYLNPSIEESVSDKFLTWGWEGDLPQHTKSFIFKNLKIKHRFKNKLILVELHPSQRCTTWDDVFEFSLYFKNQIIFCSKLSKHIRKNLIVRLHSDSNRMEWFEIARWNAYDQSIKIDVGVKSIERLIEKSKLVVFSYDSSGLLEMISGGHPCMAFWAEGLQHLQSKAVPVYRMLEAVGIIHFSPDSIASKINEIWDDIDGWWSSAEVKKAREEYCRQYINRSKNLLIDIHQLLNK